MTWRSSFAIAVTLSVMLVIGNIVLAGSNPASATGVQVSFSKDVLPIFKDNCTSCHQPGGEGQEKSGLDLQNYEGLMGGTKYGPIVVPGNPETSNLMWLLDWKAAPELRMPHGRGQLPEQFRDTIRRCDSAGRKKQLSYSPNACTRSPVCIRMWNNHETISASSQRLRPRFASIHWGVPDILH